MYTLILVFHSFLVYHGAASQNTSVATVPGFADPAACRSVLQGMVTKFDTEQAIAGLAVIGQCVKMD